MTPIPLTFWTQQSIQIRLIPDLCSLEHCPVVLAKIAKQKKGKIRKCAHATLDTWIRFRSSFTRIQQTRGEQHVQLLSGKSWLLKRLFFLGIKLAKHCCGFTRIELSRSRKYFNARSLSVPLLLLFFFWTKCERGNCQSRRLIIAWTYCVSFTGITLSIFYSWLFE